MSEKNRARQDASTLVTLLCGLGLTAIALMNAPPLMMSVAMVLLVALIVAQYQQRKLMHSIITRSHCFYQLGRRLVRLKRHRQRESNLAVNVLNHMVNQSHIAGNTKRWQQPVGKFSGDIAITCESQSGKTYVLLADLTGHGIAAAIGATPVATIFQATAYRDLSIQEIVTETNGKLKKLLPFGHFCCAAVAKCDGNTLEVCNAGLPDILVCNDQGAIVDRVSSTLLPLGIEDLQSCDVSTFARQYPQPHHLYAFTDGLIETRSANAETFDSDTVEAIIASQMDTPDRLTQVVKRFQVFSKGIQPHDDISIVEVKIC